MLKRFLYTTSVLFVTALYFPIGKKQVEKRSFSINLFNEVFINYGNGIGSHYFDQNWIYGGVEYKLRNNSRIKLGYMNQYLPKSDGVRVENNHTLSVGFTYNFDFCAKKA